MSGQFSSTDDSLHSRCQIRCKPFPGVATSRSSPAAKSTAFEAKSGLCDHRTQKHVRLDTIIW